MDEQARRWYLPGWYVNLTRDPSSSLLRERIFQAATPSFSLLRCGGYNFLCDDFDTTAFFLLKEKKLNFHEKNSRKNPQPATTHCMGRYNNFHSKETLKYIIIVYKHQVAIIRFERRLGTDFFPSTDEDLCVFWKSSLDRSEKERSN